MSAERPRASKRSFWGLVGLIYIAFVALGMPDGLLGVGWPSMRADFGIPLDAVGTLLFSGMIGYMVSSGLSGPLTARWGVGKVLIASCLATGAALLGYSLSPSWALLVGLGLVSGLGAGGVDSSLNAYVAAHFDSGLMQWLHASYGIGVTTGPLLMTWFLSRNNAWRNGYLVVGLFQLVLAAVFVWMLPLWQRQPELHQDAAAPADLPKPGLWKSLGQGAVWLGLLLFLLYVSAEVILGTWAFSLLTESRGFTAEMAGLLTGAYWGTFTIGRILAGLLTRRIPIRKLVKGCLILSLIGAGLLVWNPWPLSSALAVMLLGFSFAPVYPGLVTLTGERTGALHASNAIGLQQAAGIFGATLLNAGSGVIARQVSLEAIPVGIMVVLLVLFLLFLKGHGSSAPVVTEAEKIQNSL